MCFRRLDKVLFCLNRGWCPESVHCPTVHRFHQIENHTGQTCFEPQVQSTSKAAISVQFSVVPNPAHELTVRRRPQQPPIADGSPSAYGQYFCFLSVETKKGYYDVLCNGPGQNVTTCLETDRGRRQHSTSKLDALPTFSSAF